MLKLAFMRLQEKFNQYLRKKISLAKMLRLFKKNIHLKKAYFFDILTTQYGNSRKGPRQPRKMSATPKSASEGPEDFYEAIKSYITDEKPKKTLTKKSVDRAFAAQKIFRALDLVFNRARTVHDAFASLKRSGLLVSPPKQTKPATTKAVLKAARAKLLVRDPAIRDKYCSGVKKLSDFIFKHKESAFYHLKLATVDPNEARYGSADKAQTRDSYRNKISQFFAYRKNRNMKSTGEHRSSQALLNDQQVVSNGRANLLPDVRSFSPGPSSGNLDELSERESVKRNKLAKLNKIFMNQTAAFKDKQVEKYLRYEHSCYQIVRIYKGALKREFYYAFENLKNWRTFDPKVQQKMVRIISKWKAHTERKMHRYLMIWRDKTKRDQIALNTFRNFISIIFLRKKIVLEKAFLRIQLAAVTNQQYKSLNTSPDRMSRRGIEAGRMQKKASARAFSLILEKFVKMRRREILYRAYKMLKSSWEISIKRGVRIREGSEKLQHLVSRFFLLPFFKQLKDFARQKAEERRDIETREVKLFSDERSIEAYSPISMRSEPPGSGSRLSHSVTSMRRVGEEPSSDDDNENEDVTNEEIDFLSRENNALKQQIQRRSAQKDSESFPINESYGEKQAFGNFFQQNLNSKSSQYGKIESKLKLAEKHKPTEEEEEQEHIRLNKCKVFFEIMQSILVQNLSTLFEPARPKRLQKDKFSPYIKQIDFHGQSKLPNNESFENNGENREDGTNNEKFKEARDTDRVQEISLIEYIPSIQSYEPEKNKESYRLRSKGRSGDFDSRRKVSHSIDLDIVQSVQLKSRQSESSLPEEYSLYKYFSQAQELEVQKKLSEMEGNERRELSKHNEQDGAANSQSSQTESKVHHIETPGFYTRYKFSPTQMILLAERLDSILRLANIRALSFGFRKLNQNDLSLKLLRKLQEAMKLRGTVLMKALLSLEERLRRLILKDSFRVLADYKRTPLNEIKSLLQSRNAEYFVRNMELFLKTKTKFLLNVSFTKLKIYRKISEQARYFKEDRASSLSKLESERSTQEYRTWVFNLAKIVEKIMAKRMYQAFK